MREKKKESSSLTEKKASLRYLFSSTGGGGEKPLIISRREKREREGSTLPLTREGGGGESYIVHRKREKKGLLYIICRKGEKDRICVLPNGGGGRMGEEAVSVSLLEGGKEDHSYHASGGGPPFGREERGLYLLWEERKTSTVSFIL